MSWESQGHITKWKFFFYFSAIFSGIFCYFLLAVLLAFFSQLPSLDRPSYRDLRTHLKTERYTVSPYSSMEDYLPIQYYVGAKYKEIEILCLDKIFRQGTICPDAILRPDEIFSMDESGVTVHLFRWTLTPYKKVCPSVRPSVSPSVRPSARP